MTGFHRSASLDVAVPTNPLRGCCNRRLTGGLVRPARDGGVAQSQLRTLAGVDRERPARATPPVLGVALGGIVFGAQIAKGFTNDFAGVGLPARMDFLGDELFQIFGQRDVHAQTLERNSSAFQVSAPALGPS